MKPIMLDAFSCAGLISDGYQDFFDVVCLDNDPRALRHAVAGGHEVVEGDAMQLLADPGFMRQFDVVHASPPCQASSATRKLADAQGRGIGRAVDLLEPVSDLLNAWGGPWVMENVDRSALKTWPGSVRLCGSTWWLPIQRHRWFAPGCGLTLTGSTCHHERFEVDPVSGKPRPWGVYYTTGDNIPSGGRTVLDAEHGHRAMGVHRTVPWKYLCEGLPPVYGQHIGRQIAAQLKVAA